MCEFVSLLGRHGLWSTPGKSAEAPTSVETSVREVVGAVVAMTRVVEPRAGGRTSRREERPLDAARFVVLDQTVARTSVRPPPPTDAIIVCRVRRQRGGAAGISGRHLLHESRLSDLEVGASGAPA